MQPRSPLPVRRPSARRATKWLAVVAVVLTTLVGALAGSISVVIAPSRIRTVTVDQTKTLVLTRSFDTRKNDQSVRDAFARSRGGVALTIGTLTCRSFEGADRLWNAVICITPRRLLTSPPRGSRAAQRQSAIQSEQRRDAGRKQAP